MRNARIVSVNVGREVGASWAGQLKRTAIDKRPVAAAVPAGALGLAGDEQADKVDHGGPDQALYAYARRIWTGGPPGLAASYGTGRSARTSPPPDWISMPPSSARSGSSAGRWSR
jgi:hypothetical protein